MAKVKAEDQDKQPTIPAAPASAAAAELPDEIAGLTGARPTTDANVWIQIIGSVICTIILCVSLHFVYRSYGVGLLKYVNGLINQRGPIQWLELISFFVIVFFILQKNRILKTQIQHIADDTAQISGVNMESEEELQGLRKRIQETGGGHQAAALNGSRRPALECFLSSGHWKLQMQTGYG